MNPSSPHSPPHERAEDRFADLLEMGFERVVPPASTVESARIDEHTCKVSQVRSAMGSFVTITALHESEGLAAEAIGHAFVEMDRVIGLLNRFDGGSALSALNDTGALRGAPPELVRVVSDALGYHRLTGGAFDVTVKPLIDLFRDPQTYEPLSPPSEDELRDARELVGSRHVRLEGIDLRLTRAGMGLTLDGIAKGFVVDSMANALQSRGADRFLINAGGDIRTGGNRPDQLPWRIAVRDPASESASWDSRAWEPAAAPALIGITNGAIATSGSYEVYFDDDRLAHHIVDGESGRSPAAASVTVTAPSAMEADALATAVFALGAERGVQLIDGLGGRECLIIGNDGRSSKTRGWNALGGG